MKGKTCDVAHKFLFNGAVRGIEYTTSPNGLIRHHLHRDLLFWSLTRILPNQSLFFLLLFFCQLPIKILTFVSRSLSCRRNYKPMVLSSYLTTGLITLFFFLFHDSQWKPFIQDIQAQEEYPRGISPVRVVETCRGHSRKWEPAHGSHVAWGWRLEWMGRSEQ